MSVDKRYLLLSAVPGWLAATICLSSGFFLEGFNSIWYLMWCAVAGVILYRTYESSIKPYKNSSIDVIFIGFHWNSLILSAVVILLSLHLFNSDHYAPDFMLLTTSLFLLSLQSGIKFVVFDFARKKVTGLVSDIDFNTDHMKVEETLNAGEFIIKVSDNDGYIELDRGRYSARSWTMILSNLHRIRIENERREKSIK